MGRWEPDARGRLERAALELYLERGYDQTTVAEIAGRAGLTERTFFRHFSDKREVLFRGDELAQAMADAIDAAPETTAPWTPSPPHSIPRRPSFATAARTPAPASPSSMPTPPCRNVSSSSLRPSPRP